MFEPKVSQKLTFHAKKCLKESENLAIYENSKEIMPKHLFYAVYLEKGCLGNTILKNMGLDENNSLISTSIFEVKKKQKISDQKPEASQELKSIITRAYYLASSFNYPYVGTEHFVYALLDSDSKEIKNILKKFNPDSQKSFEKIINSSIKNESISSLSKIFDLPDITLSKTKNNSKNATPYLDQFCINLNQYVIEKNEIIVGRENEIERIINILGRKGKNNPILIGDPGVGKTALVSKLAMKINSEEVPEKLINKKILSLDMALVVAGTSFRGEFEARLKEILREARENKNVILFIDEIHSVVGAGNLSGGLDAANILKPSLSRGELQCIGATTISEFKKYFEKDPALERRFQPLKVNEPSLEETKKIIFGIKESYEEFHKVQISKEAIEQAVNLSARYINNRFLPDKSIDLIDEAASRVKNKEKFLGLERKIKILENERERLIKKKNDLVGQEKYDEAIYFRKKEAAVSKKIENLRKKSNFKNKEKVSIIEGSEIAAVVSQITGIPIEKLLVKKSSLKIKNLEKNLKSKIIGQKEALKKISDVLLRSSSGISNPERPLGSFLFLGPTGVGKTLTAKILAQDFFGSLENLVRIDMSELMERHNISRLIGAPAGYVGFEEGGKLTEKIRHQPYSIVLFDEIEKAHPDVFNILLQILEEGILTDAEGKLVNFRNTILILTSNLGTSEFTSSAKIGFKSKGKKAKENFQEIKERVVGVLKKQIKPEIINRLDHIIVFNPLEEKDIKMISKIEILKLKKRLMLQGIEISFQEKVSDFIAKKSLAFDQGARLIRRNIQDLIENEIARIIVKGKMKNNKISLAVKNNKIISS